VHEWVHSKFNRIYALSLENPARHAYVVRFISNPKTHSVRSLSGVCDRSYGWNSLAVSNAYNYKGCMSLDVGGGL